MAFTLYRLPNTEQFLRDDGVFTREREAGDQILELANAPQTVGIAYVGTALQQLTTVTSEEVPWYEGASYKAFKESLELLQLGYGTVSLAVELNKWITGSHDQPDPAMQALAEIHSLLKQVQDFSLASWVTSREENLAFLRAHSATALHTAHEFLKSGASTANPAWTAKIALADRDSLLAVNTLMGSLESGFWMRPYSLAAISLAGDPTDYYRGWMPHMPDRVEVNGFGQVWDHRWALPALLYALSVRITVLRAFSPRRGLAPPEWCMEVDRYSAYLSRVWTKIESGVRRLKFEQYSTEQIQRLRTSGHCPVCAVDIYGGNYVAHVLWPGDFDPDRWRSWQGPRPPKAWITPDISEAGIRKNVDNVGLWWYNHICVTLGLPELLLYLGELQRLCDNTLLMETIGKWAGIILEAKTSDHHRYAALAAASIAVLTAPSEQDDSATRTFYLYRALREGVSDASAIMVSCAEQLIHIAEG